MTLKESYQSAYAAKNKAIKAQYTAKKKTLSSKKASLQAQGEEELRKAYAAYMRSLGVAGQQNRADGRYGGAAENQKAGLSGDHKQAQKERADDTARKVAEVDAKIKTERAAMNKKVADNNTALKQKLDNLAIKEATSSKGGGKSGALTRSQVLSMLRMGIYDESFADILGISEAEVRDYLFRYDEKNKKDGDKNTNLDELGRLPGTYKPPLK